MNRRIERFHFLRKTDIGTKIAVITEPVSNKCKPLVLKGVFDKYDFMHPQYSKTKTIFLTQQRGNRKVQVTINVKNVREVRQLFKLPGKTY